MGEGSREALVAHTCYHVQKAVVPCTAYDQATGLLCVPLTLTYISFACIRHHKHLLCLRGAMLHSANTTKRSHLSACDAWARGELPHEGQCGHVSLLSKRDAQQGIQSSVVLSPPSNAPSLFLARTSPSSSCRRAYAWRRFVFASASLLLDSARRSRARRFCVRRWSIAGANRGCTSVITASLRAWRGRCGHDESSGALDGSAF